MTISNGLKTRANLCICHSLITNKMSNNAFFPFPCLAPTTSMDQSQFYSYWSDGSREPQARFSPSKSRQAKVGLTPVSPQPVQYAVVASLLAMSTTLPPCLITRCHIHVNFDGSWTGRAPNIPANFLSFSQGLRILQAHTTADCRVKHRPQCLSPKTPASPCPKPGKCSCSQL